MSRALICQWLKLPPDPWPPDHYTLLGVAPAEKDIARIEQVVEQRMQTVRRYQLTHPDPATEALNLLARAFVCLSDPATRKAYDAALFGTAEPAADAEPDEAPEQLLDVPEPVRVPVEAAVAAPPRIRPSAPARSLAPAEVPLLPAEPAAPPVAIPLEQPAAREKVDPAIETARSSPAARRGLGTRRAVIQRLVHTRRLARAWESAGKFLAWPKRRLTRTDAPELTQTLGDVRTELRGFPPMIGEAGQPGYLVAALARQNDVPPKFQSLLSSQREALARDWWAGRTLLGEHREFLRQELRKLRKKSRLGRAAWAVTSAIADQPGRLLLLLALIAINFALWRAFCSPDPNQTQTIWPSPAPAYPPR